MILEELHACDSSIWRWAYESIFWRSYNWFQKKIIKYTLSETANTRLGRVGMSNLCRGNRPICDLYGNLQQEYYFNS